MFLSQIKWMCMFDIYVCACNYNKQNVFATKNWKFYILQFESVATNSLEMWLLIVWKNGYY